MENESDLIIIGFDKETKQYAIEIENMSETTAEKKSVKSDKSSKKNKKDKKSLKSKISDMLKKKNNAKRQKTEKKKCEEKITIIDVSSDGEIQRSEWESLKS